MRRRLAVLCAVAVAAGAVAWVLVARDRGSDAPAAAVAVPDPLAPYDPARRAELERRATTSTPRRSRP